jgi:16S rRNA (guanine527-N7)-methyltransferase
VKPDDLSRTPDPTGSTGAGSNDTSEPSAVSRETTRAGDLAVEPTPSAAAAIFGSRLELAERYADLVATEATVRGLIGPGELPRIWTRHLMNCAVLEELIPSDAHVIDVGSGAGLPGIPLAIARPDLTVTLVEPLLRRSGWLDDIVGRLGLTTVTVRRARAEDLVGSLSAGVVTARAVAPMGRLARWCLPLVSPDGELLAMKGQGAEAELAVAAPQLRRLRAVGWGLETIGLGRLADPTSVIRVKVGTSAAPTRRSRTGSRSHPRGRGGEA